MRRLLQRRIRLHSMNRASPRRRTRIRRNEQRSCVGKRGATLGRAPLFYFARMPYRFSRNDGERCTGSG
jgi:hypothetical protein